MKERSIDGKRAVVAYHQPAGVAEPCDHAVRPPSPLVGPQRPAVLRRGVATILVARGDQLDAAPGQLLPQRVTVVAAPDDDAGGLLPRTTGVMPPSYADRLKRRLREPDPAGRDSVKVVSRRNTRAVDLHHPLRSLAPLGPRGQRSSLPLLTASL